jgi:hypothetical protein
MTPLIGNSLETDEVSDFQYLGAKDGVTQKELPFEVMKVFWN